MNESRAQGGFSEPDIPYGLRTASKQELGVELVCVAAKNHWAPRVKTPLFYKYGQEVLLSQLDHPEVDRLLSLVETSRELRQLVESGFSGLSRGERGRRLILTSITY